jgi:hypothetical protein
MAGTWMVACFLHAILMTTGAPIAPKDTTGKPADTAPAGGGNGQQKPK